MTLLNLNFILRIAAVVLGIVLAKKYSKKRVPPRTALIQALIILVLGGLFFGFGPARQRSPALILVIDFAIPFTAGWLFGRHQEIPRRSQATKENSTQDAREEE